MTSCRRYLIVGATALPLWLALALQADSKGPMVSEYGTLTNYNAHNLSAKAWSAGSLVANPNPYRATDDALNNPKGQQICIFCHTPHNANVEGQAPLWNRTFSSQTFSRYSSSTLQIRVNPGISVSAQYGGGAQPDGSSKLCLSCHDGVSNLGAVYQGGPITMVTGFEKIAPLSLASFNPSTNKMKTGHHPVSFVYTGSVQQAISSARPTYSFKLPTSQPRVKLDRNNKMQCTTCHDAHQNQSDDTSCYNSGGAIVTCDTTNTRKVVPFWVLHNGSNTASNDHDDVCTSCHNMSLNPSKPSWP